MRLIDADKTKVYTYELDKQVFVDAITRFISLQPTVEAIPIEWLKNELIPKAEKLGATDYVDNIRFVLEDWEAWKKYHS